MHLNHQRQTLHVDPNAEVALVDMCRPVSTHQNVCTEVLIRKRTGSQLRVVAVVQGRHMQLPHRAVFTADSFKSPRAVIDSVRVIRCADNCKVLFCRVCGFRVRVWWSWRTSRSWGYGYASVTKHTDFRGFWHRLVGSTTSSYGKFA